MISVESVAEFIQQTEAEDPKLSKALSQIDQESRDDLLDLLSRFDRNKNGSLDAEETRVARRVLGLLHRPSSKGIALLATILGYFDCDSNRVLDAQELTLAVEVLELFCKADSENVTLSNKELEVLQAVLVDLDSDGNGVIDANERTKLRDELWDPAAFLAKQKEANPKVAQLLG